MHVIFKFNSLHSSKENNLFSDLFVKKNYHIFFITIDDSILLKLHAMNQVCDESEHHREQNKRV